MTPEVIVLIYLKIGNLIEEASLLRKLKTMDGMVGIVSDPTEADIIVLDNPNRKAGDGADAHWKEHYCEGSKKCPIIMFPWTLSKAEHLPKGMREYNPEQAVVSIAKVVIQVYDDKKKRSA